MAILGDKRAQSTPGGNDIVFPYSDVLFDDNFSEGFCGWEKLHNASDGTFNTGMSPPLTLSNHALFGTHSLMLQTNSFRQNSYGTHAFAIKRCTMQQTTLSSSRNVMLEIWFSYGSENNNDGFSGNSGGAPRALLFGIDTQTPHPALTTALNPLGGSLDTLGKRCYFIAHWRQINEFASPTPKRTADWFLNTKSPVDYNPSLTYNQNVSNGYVSPDDGNYSATGYMTDFPFNGNKRNWSYIRLTVDIKNMQYLELVANDKVLNLTKLPGQSNAPMPAPTSPYDPLFNDIGFNGGLNAVVGILNRRDTNSTASFMEIHRARMTYL